MLRDRDQRVADNHCQCGDSAFGRNDPDHEIPLQINPGKNCRRIISVYNK